MADRLAVLKLAHNALTGLPATLTLGTLRVLVKQTVCVYYTNPEICPETETRNPLSPTLRTLRVLVI